MKYGYYNDIAKKLIQLAKELTWGLYVSFLCTHVITLATVHMRSGRGRQLALRSVIYVQMT